MTAKTRLSLEELFHVTRHLKVHMEELREGRLIKDVNYLYLVVSARIGLLECSHDIVYIMREKKFKGYENLDFTFDLTIPKDVDIDTYEFAVLTYDSFKVAQRVDELLDTMTDPTFIPLDPEAANEQMKVLEKSIVESCIAIKMLKKHYGVSTDFDKGIYI